MNDRQFHNVYTKQGHYEELLLPHYFGARSDIDFVADLMHHHYGHPSDSPTLSVCDLGCGNGRVTTALAPYAESLLGVDSSQAMIEAFTDRFTTAKGTCSEIGEAVGELPAASFDVIGAFWSLSYPLMAHFEQLHATGISPNPDFRSAHDAACDLIDAIIALLKPGGHLLIEFFDSDSPEQKMVSQLWERLAAPPGGSRSFSRHLLLEALTNAECDRRGHLEVSHHSGVAKAVTFQAAREWFLQVHAKSHPLILNDQRTHHDIDAFISSHQRRDGSVDLPSGIYVIDFQAPEEQHA